MDSNETMLMNHTTNFTFTNLNDEIPAIYITIREAINKYYFPVLVPVGLIGNILSFLVRLSILWITNYPDLLLMLSFYVDQKGSAAMLTSIQSAGVAPEAMTQRHNRHLSLSVYISVLAVSLPLIWGMLIYLGTEHRLIMASPLYCGTRVVGVFSSSSSGVYLLAMAFGRFYCIIRPHKAVSFNTVKRAKTSCFVIITLNIVYNIPHIFLVEDKGPDCFPYAKNMGTLGTMYYWVSFVVNVAFPFFALLIMNSFIIHTIRTRQVFNDKIKKDQKLKSSEKQIFAILFLVTFSFLILTTPGYLYFFVINFIDFANLSLKSKIGFSMYHYTAQKIWYTNNGINFFLYILSGTKFRNDFKNMFWCLRIGKGTDANGVSNTSQVETNSISLRTVM